MQDIYLPSIPLSGQVGNGRVIGGEVSKDEEFPWQVSLRDIGSLGATNFCGGSIIDKEWILTTAYCCFKCNKLSIVDNKQV